MLGKSETAEPSGRGGHPNSLARLEAGRSETGRMACCFHGRAWSCLPEQKTEVRAPGRTAILHRRCSGRRSAAEAAALGQRAAGGVEAEVCTGTGTTALVADPLVSAGELAEKRCSLVSK